MTVTLLSISLGIAIIAFVVYYVRFKMLIKIISNMEIELQLKGNANSTLMRENIRLDMMCDNFTKLCNEHHEAMICAEDELKRLKNQTAKDSISISVDADKLNEVVSKTKQQISELIIVELFSNKQHETNEM